MGGKKNIKIYNGGGSLFWTALILFIITVNGSDGKDLLDILIEYTNNALLK